MPAATASPPSARRRYCATSCGSVSTTVWSPAPRVSGAAPPMPAFCRVRRCVAYDGTAPTLDVANAVARAGDGARLSGRRE